MASIQIMTSSSIFTSPFHDASRDPEAFGSHTSCQGPPAEPHVSPVVKFRRHIASTFATKPSKRNMDFLKSEPFVPDILSLPFVAEEKSRPADGCSTFPGERKTTKPPATCNIFEPFEPFDTNIVMLDFIPDDVRKQRQPNWKLRPLSSRPSLAVTRQSASAIDLLGDDTSTPGSTFTITRSRIAAVSSKCVPHGVGQPGQNAVSVPADAADAAPPTNRRHCRCDYLSKNCRCQSERLRNSMLRGLEARDGENECSMGNGDSDSDGDYVTSHD